MFCHLMGAERCDHPSNQIVIEEDRIAHQYGDMHQPGQKYMLPGECPRQPRGTHEYSSIEFAPCVEWRAWVHHGAPVHRVFRRPPEPILKFEISRIRRIFFKTRSKCSRVSWNLFGDTCTRVKMVGECSNPNRLRAVNNIASASHRLPEERRGEITSVSSTGLSSMV